MVHRIQRFMKFRCSRSACAAMQRFFEENYRKNLSLKFIHINNVTYLVYGRMKIIVSLNITLFIFLTVIKLHFSIIFQAFSYFCPFQKTERLKMRSLSNQRAFFYVKWRQENISSRNFKTRIVGKEVEIGTKVRTTVYR
jgi:hypothetical protein